MTGTEVLSAAVTEVGRRPHPAADGPRTLRLACGRTPHTVVLDPHLDLCVDDLHVDLVLCPYLDLDLHRCHDLDGTLLEPDGPQVRCRPLQGDRVPTIHTVRGPGRPIRPGEAGR